MELGSPSHELSQSASAAGISSCTSCDLSVTFAPVAEDLYGLQHTYSSTLSTRSVCIVMYIQNLPGLLELAERL